MKFKKAWTMIELLISVSMVVLISVTLISVVKPNTQKSRIFAYSTMKNIMKGNIGIMDKYANDATKSGNLFYQNPSDSSNNTYCLEFAELFSIKGTASCTKNTTNVNVVLTNGTEIKGLASNTKTVSGATYQFKDILVDIDGFSKGLNKTWADRFPLRIFSGGKFDGNIQPINCGSDSIIKDNGDMVTLDSNTKSPYCDGKTVDYTNDSSVISYDVIVFKDNSGSEDGTSTGTPVAMSVSPLKADCMAHGGTGFYSAATCKAKGYRILAQCAYEDTCQKCNTTPEICPLKSDGTATNNLATCLAVNTNDTKCVTYLHKPSGGMSMALQALIGNLDDENDI